MISIDFYKEVVSMTDEFRKLFALISTLPSVKEKVDKFVIKNNGKVVDLFEEKLKYFIYADVFCCYASIKETLDWTSIETFSLLALVARLENYPLLQYDKLEDQLASVQKEYNPILRSVFKFSQSRKEELSFFVPRFIDAKSAKICDEYMECLALFTSIVAMADGVVTEQEREFVRKISGEKLRIWRTKELDVWREKIKEEEQNLKKYGIDKVFIDVALYGYAHCGVNVFDLREYLHIDYHSVSKAITKMEELGLIDSNGRARTNIPVAIEQMRKGSYVTPEQSIHKSLNENDYSDSKNK